MRHGHSGRAWRRRTETQQRRGRGHVDPAPTYPDPGCAAAAAAPAPTFKILVTNQVDPYDRPLSPAAIAALRAQPFAPVSDNFAGTKRKAAKLSIADGPMKSFADLNALIATFP